ncbi:MAG TPA: multicopper oxidase domain-containing protein [Puia sp.]|jgi:FtsP/CotA-like multicopper oxidase with cupredoxin domain|nr:multicopper oxidase domain-containing protein [Puia sp.]
MKKLSMGLLALMVSMGAVCQETVEYHLEITDTTVNYTGRHRHAIAVNGQLPGPTLEFTEGDTAVIYIHNMTMMATSIHWHGLIVPNRYDGVAYLTSPPIGPMQTYVARFPIVQSGTYWYHSHLMLQEQIGLYGAIVIHPRGWGGVKDKGQPGAGEDRRWKPMKEFTVLLSDWTDERPEEVQRSLHFATDWYAIRKGSTQDYGQAIRHGYLRTKLTNEWKRMLPMDVSDVAYDRFLVNGRAADALPSVHPGDTVRLRIINGSSSTYFWLRYAGGKMAVVASDGKDVEPAPVDRMIIGVSETYDVLVTVPGDGSYELQATAEDRTGYVSTWLGAGERHALRPLGPLKYLEGMKMMNGMMTMNGRTKDMGMSMSNQGMDMNAVMYPEAGVGTAVTLNYGMLRSPVATRLPDAPVQELHFNLTGNMNRYVWSIDNKVVSEADRILIRKGNNVRIILYNGTMMRHPMHLHGHFFRVLNGQGDYAPLKNVVDILPMETDTLEFAATESGDWFFHCHILYHMMSGMGRIFHYEGSPPDSAQDLRKVYADDRAIRPMARVGLESNGSDGEVMLANTRYRLQTEWRLGTDAVKGYESESHFGRYLGRMQYWLPYIGWDLRYRRSDEKEKNLFGQEDTKNRRDVICAGLQYTLPLLFTLDGRVDMKGNLRLQLGREDIALTRRLRFSLMANTDKEYMAGLRYILTKYIGLSTHYDSDMGWGGGITVNY